MNRHRLGGPLATPLSLLAAGSLLLTACSVGADSRSSVSGDYGVNLDDCLDPDAAAEEVTDTWTIGWSVPLSGPVAGVVAPALDGWKARIEQANADDELNGVTIEVAYLDDGFAPDRAKANFTEFIQKDEVDSLLVSGSGNTGAVADDQNASCTPLLYASSSADQYRDIEEYPWTVQYSPSADNEAAYDIAVIEDRFPDGATVGIAENQTETGKAFTEAFEAATEGTDIEVVVVAPLTDPNAAATDLKAASPDVVYYAAVPSDCGPITTALGRVGFKPDLTIAPSPCQDTTGWTAAGDAADGVVVPTWSKDPLDPAVAGDPDVQVYTAAIPADELANPQVTIGWMTADLTIATLKQAQQSSNGLSRASVMDAARDLDYQASMAIEGVTWVSTADHMLGFDGFQTQVWDADSQTFTRESGIISIAD